MFVFPLRRNSDINPSYAGSHSNSLIVNIYRR